jgi:N,N'-diacetyllegionaminate synthase
MTKVLVIAEAGVNHDGDLQKAKHLVDIAAEAGADFVKFQIFSPDELATSRAKLSEYQQYSLELKSQIEMLRKLQLSQRDYECLVAYAEKKEMNIFSTAFDRNSLRYLLEIGQEIVKIPSGEITNFPLLQLAGESGKTVIVSTGMSTLEEITDAVRVLEDSGAKRTAITLLQCTSCYPTSMDQVNLRAITRLRDQLALNVGFSDHTLGLEASIAAVALGASVIEKHFTISKDGKGPDHKVSLEAQELKAMILAIRNVEQALGKGNKQVMPCEVENRHIARKSIVAACKIQKGDRFTEQNLTTKRPADGLSPMNWSTLLGTIAQRNYERDDLI